MAGHTHAPEPPATPAPKPADPEPGHAPREREHGHPPEPSERQSEHPRQQVPEASVASSPRWRGLTQERGG